MFGDSDSEDDGHDYDDSRIREIVEQAEGDSVTPDRLVGEELYYPDAMQFLTEDERPQHVVLLTTSVATMQQYSGYETKGVADGDQARTLKGEGVLIVCEHFVRFVVDGRTGTIPYGNVERVQYADDQIKLLVGNLDHSFRVADSADEDEARAGFRALESRFLEAHR